MQWYVVVKTCIKGNHYCYWQKTYRVGRHVKTTQQVHRTSKCAHGQHKCADPRPSNRQAQNTSIMRARAN